MQFPKANGFPKNLVLEKIMGPNPLKLCEEMMGIVERSCKNSPNSPTESTDLPTRKIDRSDGSTRLSTRTVGNPEDSTVLPNGSVVMDLGSGTGITSALLSREYGFTTYACDLWSDPTDNLGFFQSLGLSKHQAIPLKVDATNPLPFDHGFFDAVFSIDSYHYFGRDPEFLDRNLLPYVKQDGIVAFCIPGMKNDCHDNPPACLLAAWGAEQLDYIHDADWWRTVVEASNDSKVLAVKEMTCTEEAWADWLQCDNEYAKGDALAIEAGALDYLNSITVVLRKK